MTFYGAVLALAFILLSYPPQNPDADPLYVERAALAVTQATDEPWEAETLVRIARWESWGFRRDVGSCERVGRIGARGLWQVVPRSHEEALDACSTDLSRQARLALERVRESRRVCERLGFRGADVLGLYTHGKCFHGNGFAAARYGDGWAIVRLMSSEDVRR